MNLTWIEERPARWTGDKARIIGDAATGIFDTRYRALKEGDLAPGEWWRVERDGRTVGFGWLDVVWGDAEILLASDPTAAGQGIGSFIIEHLRKEAGARGLIYLCNVVRSTHPHADAVTAWLKKRGFTASEDGRLLCRSSAKRR